MIPYRDENPTERTPYVTIALIALTVLVWLVVQGAGRGYPLARSVCEWGLIPAEISGRALPGTEVALGRGLYCRVDPGGGWSRILSSIFLHGSWWHLAGNMWFLWLFGNNVEDSTGRLRYAALYFLSGIVAGLAHLAASADSPVPTVGASGAVSGIMGAYIVLYPRVRVYTLVFLGFFVTTVALPAYLMLGYWMLIQVLGGLPQLAGVQAEGGGVAFWAHIGGFAVGAATIKLLARPEYVRSRRSHPWAPSRIGWGGGGGRWH